MSEIAKFPTKYLVKRCWRGNKLVDEVIAVKVVATSGAVSAYYEAFESEAIVMWHITTAFFNERSEAEEWIKGRPWNVDPAAAGEI